MTILAMHPMIAHLLPEIILLVGAAVILLAGLAQSDGKNRGGSTLAALVAVALAIVATWRASSGDGPAPVASLCSDSLVQFVRYLTLGMGVLILLVNRHVPEGNERSEFNALILFSLAGILFVAVANDLVLLFLSLELVSVPTYILVGLSRRNIRAQEATGKYFFLGAFAAAIMLYGFSFLYGFAGVTQILPGKTASPSIAAAAGLPSAVSDPLFLVGLLLALVGLLFKLAAFPLHFYIADVYHGAAAPVSGMLGFVPKFAGLIALMRLLTTIDWQLSNSMFWLIWLVAVATMTVGNTLALMQHNVKRMLAYSGVAHSGYMLVAMLAGPARDPDGGAAALRDGPTALLFYIGLYGIMNLGAFAAIALFRKRSDEGEDDSVEMVEDLRGVGRAHPWAALALSVCILGLMGIPPTGGFLGKLYVFSSALAVDSTRHSAMVWLVVIGVLNSAIAAAYYLRIIAVCYLPPSRIDSMQSPAPLITAFPCRALRVALALCAILVTAAFLRPGELWDRSRIAAVDLQGAGPGLSPETASAGPMGDDNSR